MWTGHGMTEFKDGGYVAGTDEDILSILRPCDYPIITPDQVKNNKRYNDLLDKINEGVLD